MMSRQSSMTHVQITQRQEQYSREKLASLAAILGHLARQQSSELRICFTKLIEVHSVVFLQKLLLLYFEGLKQ